MECGRGPVWKTDVDRCDVLRSQIPEGMATAFPPLANDHLTSCDAVSSSRDDLVLTLTRLDGASLSVGVSSCEPLKNQIETKLEIKRGYDARLVCGTEVLDGDAFPSEDTSSLVMLAQRRPLEWWRKEASESHPHCLRFADMPEDIRAERDVALGAVQRDPSQFQVLNAELRGDREIALIAVQRDISMYKHVAGPLRDDHDIAIVVLRAANWQIPTLLGKDFKTCCKFSGCHCSHPGCPWMSEIIDRRCLEILAAIDEHLFLDLDVACAAAGLHSGALALMPHFRTNSDVVIEALRSLRGVAQIAPELFADPAVAMEMVRRDGAALGLLAVELQGDRNLVAANLSQIQNAFWRLSPAVRARVAQVAKPIEAQWHSGSKRENEEDDTEAILPYEQALADWALKRCLASREGATRQLRHYRGNSANTVVEHEHELRAIASVSQRKHHARKRNMWKRWRQRSVADARVHKQHLQLWDDPDQ